MTDRPTREQVDDALFATRPAARYYKNGHTRILADEVEALRAELQTQYDEAEGWNQRALAAEGILARVALLAQAWREHAKGCDAMMRTVRNDHERGRWLGCAVQASGCAEDLERVLGAPKDKP